MAELDEVIIQELSGAQEVIQWFGRWPSFHDAEVVSVVLNREGLSEIRIHAFNMLGEVDERGYYRTTKHAIVSFVFKNIRIMKLVDFNDQNVISGLELSKTEDGFSVTLYECYGLSGYVSAERISLKIEAGTPHSSIYEETAKLNT
jgi:Immunity protein 50